MQKENRLEQQLRVDCKEDDEDDEAQKLVWMKGNNNTWKLTEVTMKTTTTTTTSAITIINVIIQDEERPFDEACGRERGTKKSKETSRPEVTTKSSTERAKREDEHG